MKCTQTVFVLTIDIQNNLCKQHVLPYSPHVLSLEFSCAELVIHWTFFCHIVDARISTSEKDLPLIVQPRARMK